MKRWTPQTALRWLAGLLGLVCLLAVAPLPAAFWGLPDAVREKMAPGLRATEQAEPWFAATATPPGAPGPTATPAAGHPTATATPTAAPSATPSPVQTPSWPWISTFAGNGSAAFAGDGGPAGGGSLNDPVALALDAHGNLFIADFSNHAVREVSAGGMIATVAGQGPPATPGYGGDGGPASAAAINYPYGVAVNTAGDLFIADTVNQVVRRVGAVGGLISTVAGNGTQGYQGDGGPATAAELANPSGIAVDGAGDLFITDRSNNVIRRVDASSGIITTVAGNGTQGYSGDWGPATAGELAGPIGVAVDAAGDLFIADTGNEAVREVHAAGGAISTLAGDGTAGYSGDAGPAGSAELDSPVGVACDPSGNLYIADSGNNAIREVTLPGAGIRTVVGDGSPGSSGDGGPATSAELNYPWGMVVDGLGHIYVADSGNNVVRVVR